MARFHSQARQQARVEGEARRVEEADGDDGEGEEPAGLGLRKPAKPCTERCLLQRHGLSISQRHTITPLPRLDRWAGSKEAWKFAEERLAPRDMESDSTIYFVQTDDARTAERMVYCGSEAAARSDKRLPGRRRDMASTRPDPSRAPAEAREHLPLAPTRRRFYGSARLGLHDEAGLISAPAKPWRRYA